MKKLKLITQVPLPTSDEVRAFEEINGVILPKHYKAFLMEQNAFQVVESYFSKDEQIFRINLFYPFQISGKKNNQGDNLQQVYEDFLSIFGKKHIAFADDTGGWQFVISLKEEDYGKVYFCRMDMDIPEALTLLADNFEEFINGLEKPTYE